MALSTSILRKIEASKKSGTLNLRGEGLSSLPIEAYNRASRDNWFDTVDLVQLVVSHNAIKSLPEDIGILYELKLVDASHNQLSQLPVELFGISELRSIDISHNKFERLPDEIGTVSTLVSLSCGSNQLTELPSEFGANLFQLTKLEAEENQLTSLPLSIKNAQDLALLNLEKNRILRLPEDIFRGLGALTELNLDNNQMTELPKAIQHLKNLKILRARYNQLTSIPDEISKCNNLLELYLGHNRLGTLTDAIGALSSLVVLDLTTNGLEAFPAAPCRGLRLQTLDLSNNNLTGLPGEVGLITTLRRLPLDGNPLRTVRRDLTTGPVSRLLDSLRKKLPVEEPEGEVQPFGGRVMITGDPLTHTKNILQSYVTNQNPGELDLSKMGLKDIPSDIWMHIAYVCKLVLNDNNLVEFDGSPMSEAIRLRVLLMQNCQLQQWPLPYDPESLSTLRELDLSRNKQLPIPENAFLSCADTLSELNLNGVLSVSSLPEESFICLRSLQSISLSMTRLRNFPQEFLAMPSLTYIDLCQNEIQTLPEDVTKLTRLEYLDVSNNSISALPVRIGFMDPVLKTFQVQGNILKTIRRSALEKGTASLLEYLRERAPPQ